WRGNERINSKEDLFSDEENKLNDKMVKEGEKENTKKNVPMKIRKETLNYDKRNKPAAKVQQSNK
ncbi:MAG: hypothetical protein ACI9Q9_000928, partial [Flavobacterium sp.]